MVKACADNIIHMDYCIFCGVLGRYSTEHIVDFVKDKLKSMPCQNQGFVLDGFPKTYEEAQQLFARKQTIK